MYIYTYSEFSRDALPSVYCRCHSVGTREQGSEVTGRKQCVCCRCMFVINYATIQTSAGSAAGVRVGVAPVSAAGINISCSRL